MPSRMLAAFFASFALAACGADATRAADAQDDRPLVEVVAAAPAAAAGIVQASGLIGYKRETELSFSAPGVIESILVDEGDIVRAGQRLATLRRTTVGANAAEAALARQTAERQLTRTQTLFDRGFVSQAAMDDARLAVERSRESSAIAAPAAGIILRRNAERAQTVAAGQAVLVFGETAFGIVVRAAVSSADAARVRVGAPAQVRLGAGPPRQGEVARIGAKSNDATGAFEIEIRLAESADLRSGQVADVEIAGDAGLRVESALIVPTLALLDARADQGTVFVIDAQGIARRRAVETAGLAGDGVIVVDGLRAGERVVSAGAAFVRDGEPVRLARGG